MLPTHMSDGPMRGEVFLTIGRRPSWLRGAGVKGSGEFKRLSEMRPHLRVISREVIGSAEVEPVRNVQRVQLRASLAPHGERVDRGPDSYCPFARVERGIDDSAYSRRCVQRRYVL
ncbi:hypothetical protein GCM10009851_33030 [Herbiconiux moechotypicola]|uniref:Uncharacterized protein n=1 Tax=Herbiconiux moechotypicola TaxID=637393 RepID=A0ABP5QYE6_9MICO